MISERISKRRKSSKKKQRNQFKKINRIRQRKVNETLTLTKFNNCRQRILRTIPALSQNYIFAEL